ncbi:hypothetical protein [Pseudoalteromonas sp. 10-33]|uniref:hypothetical protein n=1 Tax=Pseudoalteromonas sp. 10-33 TaxID=1761890 RepID=UPI00073217C0|nr:hypothetical protein [Pseudoalteromonas sp. 10-33]KTF16360.1 hypothetical protein ATS76_16970 [Pseudoalteromonas sp. 10-33]
MNNVKKPNQHIIALISFLALIPLVYFIPDFIGRYVTDNKLLNVIVAVGIIVPLISYVVVPLSLKLLDKKLD